MEIIGISGPIGSGKSTVSRLLKQCYADNGKKVVILSLGHKVKEVCCLMFKWDINRLNDDYAYKEGNTNDDGSMDLACTLLNVRSRREVLQRLGTDGVRNGFNTDAWVIALEMEMQQIKDDYDVAIIPDIRFLNEIAMIEKSSGINIQISRDNNHTTKETKHISEQEWRQHQVWDAIIDNTFDPTDDSMDNLKQSVKDVYHEFN